MAPSACLPNSWPPRRSAEEAYIGGRHQFRDGVCSDRLCRCPCSGHRTIMFKNACKQVRSLLMPIILASKKYRGPHKVSLAAGMVINAEGWVLLSGHVLERVASIEQSAIKAKEEVKKNRRRPKISRNTVTEYVFKVGPLPFNPIEGIWNNLLDIGVIRLEGYQHPAEIGLPVFRADDVEQGELLCRIGYPFHKVKARWSRDKGFEFPSLFPVPAFVNEALVSRFVNVSAEARFIETSTPGLKGQSGGPLIDVDGCICGIQSHTESYSLGFKPKNQFIHVGRALHVTSVRDFLDKNNIAYTAR